MPEVVNALNMKPFGSAIAQKINDLCLCFGVGILKDFRIIVSIILIKQHGTVVLFDLFIGNAVLHPDEGQRNEQHEAQQVVQVFEHIIFSVDRDGEEVFLEMLELVPADVFVGDSDFRHLILEDTPRVEDLVLEFLQLEFDGILDAHGNEIWSDKFTLIFSNACGVTQKRLAAAGGKSFSKVFSEDYSLFS